MTEIIQHSLKYYLSPKSTSKKTLVLDLDETLVHSQFVPFSIKSDLIIKIELENQLHDIHVLIRPGVKKFLEKMGKLYEIVIFTASVSKYADPLLDIIDKNNNCSCRLFREHCSMVGIAYIKDLKKLGRDLKDIIIVDNSPLSYSFNHENGLPILTWFNDKNDRELYNITPILEFLSNVYDVRDYIKHFVVNDSISYDNAINVIENYGKTKNDDSCKKIIEQILYNKNNYINNKKDNGNNINKDNFYYEGNKQIIINNNNYNTTNGKQGKKNYVNITISNNSINNYLYFSPIYNINNPLENKCKNNGDILIQNNDNNNFDVKLNKKSPQTKNKILNTKTNRTKSKGLLNKITIIKRAKIKNKSKNFKKINNYISNKNINKNLKDKLNSAGNKSINNFNLNINNNSEIKDYSILDLKTIVPEKKNNLIKDFQLPKTPEIEEILYPLHERIISNINNARTLKNLSKKIIQSKRGNSSDKNRNGSRYQLRNSLYKINSQFKPNSIIINHEKHKSFNYYAPFNFEENIASFTNNNFNNYIFMEHISSIPCKNNSHSNHKYNKTITKKNRLRNNNNLSLNLVNKNFGINNEYGIQRKKNTKNNKSKITLINNNHKKALSNQFRIIGITEYNKSNKVKKLLNYNLNVQNSISNSINNTNYKKINSTNRSITNTDISYNNSIKNYNRNIACNNNYNSITNNLNNKINQLISKKKVFNNSTIKNGIKRHKTNSNNFVNYDNIINHKKTLSFNVSEINNNFKTVKRTYSSTLSKNKNNLNNIKNNHKDINLNNQKNNNINKSSKREINDMNKKLINKITRIKEIQYINAYGNNSLKRSNKTNIYNNNMIYNLIDKSNNINLNKIKNL